MLARRPRRSGSVGRGRGRAGGAPVEASRHWAYTSLASSRQGPLEGRTARLADRESIIVADAAILGSVCKGHLELPPPDPPPGRRCPGLVGEACQRSRCCLQRQTAAPSVPML